MTARTIATVFVCLAVVFAGCGGMNDGTGGDSSGDGAAGDTASEPADDTPTATPGDTTTAPPDGTTADDADGPTTQSTATTATAADEATTTVGSPTAAGTTTMAPETTAAPTATSTATAQPTATITTAAPATSDSGATTTDAPNESGGGDSASVSNPFTEGEYYRITVQITAPTVTTEYTVEFRVLSVDGEQVTVKFTNLESGESITVQDESSKVFTTLDNKGFPKSVWFATLFSFAHAVQEHSMTVGSKWTGKSMTFTVTGTDTVAGVSCKTVKIVSEDAEGTVCVNKDVTFALRFVLHSGGGGATTITVEEYRSGEDG